MCGIIGCVGHGDDTLDVILDGLETLEYRGYDSAGVALADEAIDVEKKEGRLEMLRELIAGRDVPPAGPVGIGHTRWSTHGPPTDANAHPHTDESGRVAVVHNGIIENYQALRDELEAEGVTFTSDTDTEVIPHLFAAYLDAELDPEAAFRRTLERIEGSYAIAAVVAGDDRIFATRNDSPLVLGVGDGRYYLASDVPAFLEHTRDVVYLDDGEVAIVDSDGWAVTDRDGDRVEKDVSTVTWSAEQTGKSGYDHYMLKEIHEQPTALRQGLSGRLDELSGTVTVEELDDVGTPETVHFVACGTSYHAALYGVELFREAGIPAQAFLASEYATGPAPIPESGLVVGVTQSGETADTLSALREAQGRGAETLALTNVVGSTAARECDHALYIRSGPEIGVAATKTFSSQLTALNLLAETLTNGGVKSRDLVAGLRDVPGDIQQVLDQTNAEEIVDKYLSHESFFFIGRGQNFPVALEGALKFKEITYEHAEGFAAGELKHGPLALVTQNTPVFAIVTGDDERARKTIGNVKEVEARDAPVIAVTDGKSDVERYADHVLMIPETHPRTAPMLANVQLQLVAYHMANRLGRAIDKPRNLAKSVTVE
ncbi:glutamine--fructose-6-phosphate transaminase (isomerizing) [Halobaculum sp. WSA2]|uniref:Glutamine--fructose-6-phosphate aminotransferase [isomerizing] n=1 Tax=Halobaculum saliterrae TaxID=2073113 RepID=A0A6B0SZ60_9EURY|nr:glutamine--fructose-6-phosphate transaminase (isomerizing) [Halobaculum saliterrae]MXR41863.1 glutamine--fructose-6-phosphate transaminase (isomerizing) [Halobaculum saliterrae]